MSNDLYKRGLRFANLGLLSSTDAVAAEIGKLRVGVWTGVCQQMGRPPKPQASGLTVWHDDVDFNPVHATQHLVCYCENELVAASRLSIHAGRETLQYSERLRHSDCPLRYPVAMFARTVVNHQFSGLGVASYFDIIRMNLVRSTQARSIFTGATSRRVLPLKRHRFHLYQQFLENESDRATFCDTEITLMWRETDPPH